MNRSNVIAEVRVMINTGASKRVIYGFIDTLYKLGDITSRMYELLTGMIEEA